MKRDEGFGLLQPPVFLSTRQVVNSRRNRTRNITGVLASIDAMKPQVFRQKAALKEPIFPLRFRFFSFASPSFFHRHGQFGSHFRCRCLLEALQ